MEMPCRTIFVESFSEIIGDQKQTMSFTHAHHDRRLLCGSAKLSKPKFYEKNLLTKNIRGGKCLFPTWLFIYLQTIQGFLKRTAWSSIFSYFLKSICYLSRPYVIAHGRRNSVTEVDAEARGRTIPTYIYWSSDQEGPRCPSDASHW